MPSYRLLRSNKESGPYTLNDLVALGLKPYDLVWVDGRSAAWRYPSEVDELKEYAPAIEEQPYDRFYKKPSETEPSIKEPVANSEKIYQQTTINESFAKEEPAKNIPIAIGIEKPAENKEVKTTIPEIHTTYQSPEPKKKVFVSMPETNGFEPYQNTSQGNRHDQQQYEQNQYQQYLPKPKNEQVKQKPIEERSYSPISVQESDESKLETKYTQSLDDIKEMYINTLVQRKTKNRRKEILKKLRPVLIPVLLLAAGFAIGYVIKTKKSPLQASQTVSTVVPPQTVPDQKKDSISTANTDNKITQPEENKVLPSEKQNSFEPIGKTSAKTDNDKDKNSQGEQEQVTVQQQKQYKNAETELPKAVLTEKRGKESSAPDNEVATYQKKNVEVDLTTGERKKVVRDDDEIASSQSDSRNNTAAPGKRNPPTGRADKTEPNFIETDHKDLRDLVSVHSNNYVRGTFGGITGLELTVSNNSDFLLDEVSVELQIMKPSEQPLRTDIITFKNVGSNKSITVKVPDSQRGIRVDYRITNIESKQWEKSTAGL